MSQSNKVSVKLPRERDEVDSALGCIFLILLVIVSAYVANRLAQDFSFARSVRLECYNLGYNDYDIVRVDDTAYIYCLDGNKPPLYLYTKEEVE